VYFLLIKRSLTLFRIFLYPCSPFQKTYPWFGNRCVGVTHVNSALTFVRVTNESSAHTLPFPRVSSSSYCFFHISADKSCLALLTLIWHVSMSTSFAPLGRTYRQKVCDKDYFSEISEQSSFLFQLIEL